MRILKFNLEGNTAFFKIPEVNSVCYFTYGNIHKPALLGLLGAIKGYKGYQQKYTDWPEYYTKLKDLKVSILPQPKDGYFHKKIQSFNNSVGYASTETGGNLIIKEQWIENPQWTIYVKLDNEASVSIAESILKNKCIYMPYLGKNDHPATITDVAAFEAEEADPTDKMIRCIMPENLAEFDYDEMTFKYEEFLPLALSKETNHYVSKKFILTDATAIYCKTVVYKDGENNIVFY